VQAFIKGERKMIERTRRAALLVVAVSSMLMPFFCLNVAAGDDEETTYNLYFGDLHTHTSWSDGAGTPWDAFAAAKAAGADFMAVTDHVHYPYGKISLTQKLWEETLMAAESFTSDDFVAMAGYELWLPWAGEVNVYNTDTVYRDEGNPGGHGFNNGLHEGMMEVLPSLYDWLSDTGAIGQWNHPTYWYGVNDKGFNESQMANFFDFDYYTESRDLGMSVLENLENPDYEQSYILALDAGWHIMPAANSDTHSANWISGYETRTVLLAPSLTPDDLYDAMRASRGYATQDENLRIVYTLNDEVMGSTLSAPGPTYVANIHIEDPDGTASDEITLVEIVSDHGVVVASVPTSGTTVDLTLTLSSESAQYFYVRVTTASNLSGEEGLTAWTAPVWTGN
jgi:hypothetical protein